MSFYFGVSGREELVRQRKALEKVRSDFLRAPEERLPVRSVIRASWLRCLREGIDPGRARTEDPLGGKNTKEDFECSRLYESSMPLLEELLEQVRETRHLITLSESHGRIVFLDGDRQVRRAAENINFVLGSDWSEETIGTNAIGTGLKAGCPVQVFAAEHFCEGIHDWVCSSAPIRDPVSEKVLGVVDITGSWQDAQTHTLGLAMMAARVIERDLRESVAGIRSKLKERYLAEILHYPEDGVIVLDRSFNPVEANSHARAWVEHTTGKDLSAFWSEQRLAAYFLRRYDAERRNDEDNIFLEPWGISGSIQELRHAKQGIGFLLILKTSAPRKHLGVGDPWSKIVGRCEKMSSAVAQCHKIARTDVSVLLCGESGSGKELFARAIHETSDRARGPFVALNCGAVPKELCASELFGYDPGTFTGANKEGKKGKFEQAQGGTLFLDEVGEMPLALQVHFLRVLQEREVVRLGGAKAIPVDVRIVAATHQDLEQLVLDGLFRADLYYRLSVVSVSIPPLRERRDDISLLIDHFLARLSLKYSKPPFKLDPFVKDFLIKIYRWPGNVRELGNCLERAVLFGQNGTISREDLPQSIQRNMGHSLPGSACQVSDITFDKSAGSREREALLSLLLRSDGNLSAVARQLGVARTTLYRHLDRCGVSRNSRCYE